MLAGSSCSVVFFAFSFLSFFCWFLLLPRSGADPTILGGGELAREASWEGRSDMAGVDGLLYCADDSDGLLEPFLAAERGGNAFDFSVAADGGAGSTTLEPVPVVNRNVRGLSTDDLDSSEGVVVEGVAGRELREPGVPTMPESNTGVADFSGAVAGAATAWGTAVVLTARPGGSSIFSGLFWTALPLPLASVVLEGVDGSVVFSKGSSALSAGMTFLSGSVFGRDAGSFGEPRLISLGPFLCLRTAIEAFASTSRSLVLSFAVSVVFVFGVAERKPKGKMGTAGAMATEAVDVLRCPGV